MRLRARSTTTVSDPGVGTGRRGWRRVGSAAQSPSRCFPARWPRARHRASRADAERRGPIWRRWMISRADRERRQQSRALQRLGLVRQCREPAVHAALPILQPRRLGGGCEAAQVAQGQREQAARPQCRRQRRQQAKRQRGDAAPDDDRQRGIVEISPCRRSSGWWARAAA